MPKSNLIIVHSFPTNSTFLKGLIDFLSDFFNVYFIDLPGFNKGVFPLKKISFDNYTQYVDEYIHKLNLDSYFLVGISFSFLIINNCRVDNKCKGYFAIEPLLDKKYLKDKKIDIFLQKLFLFIICKFRLHFIAYKSKMFKKFLRKSSPEDRIELLLKTIDGYTFFETARIILKNKNEPEFHNKPYILVINDNDEAIYADEVIKVFEKLDKHLIIKTTLEHYPKSLKKEYFGQHIGTDSIKKVLEYINTMK